MYPVYYVEENDTLPVLFSSYAGATGASVTLTGLAVTDIEIYKDVSMTQRASDAGYTLLDTDGIDIDSTTGIHGFSIDLSDNTTAGFYTVGPWYYVVVSAVTIDTQTVNFIACAFRIVSATRGMAGTALPAAAADAAGGLPISDAGGLDLDNDVANKLAAVNLDHLAGTAASIPTIPAGTYIDQMMDDGTAVYDRTTDSLQAIRDRGNAAWESETGPDETDIATAIRQAAVTQSLNAPGAQATLEELVFAIAVKVGAVGKLERVDTTLTGYAADTTTEVATWELDDNTDPTSIERDT